MTRIFPVGRVALDREPVNERDLFLDHKSTRRFQYDRHRKMFPKANDVIFWNQRKELTESTWANLVLQIRGKLFTPPVSCGLLAGFFGSRSSVMALCGNAQLIGRTFVERNAFSSSIPSADGFALPESGLSVAGLKDGLCETNGA